MSTNITTAFVKQFTQGITMLQQQQGSRLRNAVSVESGITGDRAFFDQVDATTMSKVTTRHGDTAYTDTPHKRRMVTLSTYEVADLVDRADQIRTLNDPTNSYVQSFAAASGRAIDDAIITAFDATAATGVDGTGTDAFDATNYGIAVGAPTNMTLSKLLQARKMLELADNPEGTGDDEWFIVMGASQRQGLLDLTEVGSADYNSVKALVNGQINQFLGFTFVKSERLPEVASTNVRSCFAWRKGSMKLGIGAEPRGFIDVLPGKRHSTQVRYEADFGAVRMDQKGVVRILCDEDV